MSKSKSRQPSRQASAASKNGSGGTARTAALSKAPAKDAVDDAPESTERDAATSPIVDASNKSTAGRVVADVSASAIKETPASKSSKGVSAKAAPAKAVPNTPALRPVPNTPAGIGGKALSRDAAKYERRVAERQTRYLAERRRRRNRMITAISVVLALVIIIGGIYFVVRQSTATSVKATSHASQGSYQEAIYNSTYPPVDSVYCDQLEQSIEHIHAYVAIYIDGKASPLPAYVGIPQGSSGNATCFYWLHTHDASGIIHIESPSNEVFTFGQFRDEWDQQFVSLGFPPELLLNGWKIWINGKVYNGSLASVPLEAHNIITLAYNSPNVKPVTTYNWGSL
ncbi:MAG TPA: hypothetical protein VGM01_04150 [Ktedonobacteraceae bacterium]|jgi:hypothetical protein